MRNTKCFQKIALRTSRELLDIFDLKIPGKHFFVHLPREVTMARDIRFKEFHVEVKHHCPLPNRYTWQIHRAGQEMPISESKGEYSSWEEASCAGRKALAEWPRS
jgi:hypothetical protein